MPYSTQPAKLLSSVLARRCRRESRPCVDVLAVCPGPTETNFFQEAEFPHCYASAAAANHTHRGGGARSLQALEKAVYSRPWWYCESIDSEFTPVLPRELLVNLWKTILGRSKVKKTKGKRI